MFNMGESDANDILAEPGGVSKNLGYENLSIRCPRLLASEFDRIVSGTSSNLDISKLTCEGVSVVTRWTRRLMGFKS